MCMGGVEESMLLNGGYQSTTKLGGKLAKGLNASKDYKPLPTGKDKFAMTHCSSDFRMLKNQVSQKSL